MALAWAAAETQTAGPGLMLRAACCCWSCCSKCLSRDDIFWPGRVTNSIPFFWMFTINELCKKSAFYRHTIKFCDCWFTVLQGPTCLAEHTLEFPCFSAVLEATHNARLRPLEGRYASSKSPSRVWHWDVAGRNKSNCLPDDWLWFALRQILKCFFFYKNQKEEMR